MESLRDLKSKKIGIYGLGLTGKSVINLLRKNKIKDYFSWDDKTKKTPHVKKFIDKSDFIVISPGISLKNSPFKINLLKNKKKIISDLDLFYLLNKKIKMKTIMITGTNGKSTTCKMIEHLFKKVGIKTITGGNIGKPILSCKIFRKFVYIIEASSFQLEYSKFILPNFAIILNISSDHLDWHKTKKNYQNAKFKIFSNQSSKDYALLNSKKLILKFKKKKIKSKLIFIKKNFLKFENKISNYYLNSRTNFENMSFVYSIAKKFKINDQNFFSAMNSFKGLEHRQELIYKKKNLTIINDSKATSFEATKFALQKYDNIFWILGGLPKKNDKIELGKLRNKIHKIFIIGEHANFFKKFLKNVEYSLIKNLSSAVKKSIREAKKLDKKTTILLSPSAASYDQYKNFVDRGNKFKKYVKLYV